jgi:hypothetical protein
MMLKHLLLGRAFTPRSPSDRVMMVDMAPLKKRARLGITAPG